jgi:hypothetical protein
VTDIEERPQQQHGLLGIAAQHSMPLLSVMLPSCSFCVMTCLMNPSSA